MEQKLQSAVESKAKYKRMAAEIRAEMDDMARQVLPSPLSPPPKNSHQPWGCEGCCAGGVVVGWVVTIDFDDVRVVASLPCPLSITILLSTPLIRTPHTHRLPPPLAPFADGGPGGGADGGPGVDAQHERGEGQDAAACRPGGRRPEAH